MDRNERIVGSACGIMRLEGMIVPKSISGAIMRCLNGEATFDFVVHYMAGAKASYRGAYCSERSSDDPTCYAEGTLINKLNIRSCDLLMEKIRDVVPVRIAELDNGPIATDFSMWDLRKIHERLYSDLFYWTGELRDLPTLDHPHLCSNKELEEEMFMLYIELRDEDNLRDSDDLTGRLAHYVQRINELKPFRVGNGVTAWVFINELAKINGRYLDYSKASEGLTDVALKRAAAGDVSFLKEILDSIITDY